LLAGLGQFGDTQLFVTTGTGYWGPSVRLGSRPEIAVIELHSPARKHTDMIDLTANSLSESNSPENTAFADSSDRPLGSRF